MGKPKAFWINTNNMHCAAFLGQRMVGTCFDGYRGRSVSGGAPPWYHGFRYHTPQGHTQLVRTTRLRKRGWEKKYGIPQCYFKMFHYFYDFLEILERRQTTFCARPLPAATLLAPLPLPPDAACWAPLLDPLPLPPLRWLKELISSQWSCFVILGKLV